MARSIAEKITVFSIFSRISRFFILNEKIKPYANTGQVYHIRHAKCAFECPLYHSLALHDHMCTRSSTRSSNLRPPPRDSAPGSWPSGTSHRTCRRREDLENRLSIRTGELDRFLPVPIHALAERTSCRPTGREPCGCQ